MTPRNSQQGYALLLSILILFGASAGFIFVTYTPQANQLKHQQTQQHMALLAQVKANLLLYATSTPELYATDSNGNFYSADYIAAPGYLPCPDTNNDGATNTPCGGSGPLSIVSGRLPKAIATRHFRFIDNTPIDIWFVVDSRYVIQNTNYNNATIKRYSPLNTNLPGNGNLTLDNQSDVIAIVFLSDKSIDDHLVDAAQNRFTRLNQPSISITHDEWNSHAEGRAQAEKTAFCALGAGIQNWFNINWRSLIC